jgi:hypothetical protein
MGYYEERNYYQNSEQCPKIYGTNIEIKNRKGHYSFSRYEYDTLDYMTRACDYHGMSTSSVLKSDFIFQIKNISLIKDFRIEKIAFKEYVQIELNDNLVYIGPKDAKYLAVVTEIEKDDYYRVFSNQENQINLEKTKVYNGNEFMPFKTNTAWEIDIDINLKPFLKENENILHFKVIGNEESRFVGLRIHSEEHCPYVAISGNNTDLFAIEADQ